MNNDEKKNATAALAADEETKNQAVVALSAKDEAKKKVRDNSADNDDDLDNKTTASFLQTDGGQPLG
jgi:hypothetical protein